MNIEEIIAVIANAPKSLELQIIEDTCNSIKEKNVNVEIRKRFSTVSDKKILVTFEILFKDTTVFQAQSEIYNTIEKKDIQPILVVIDRYFLSGIIKFALTYKSISAKDYQDLLYYRRKFGNI